MVVGAGYPGSDDAGARGAGTRHRGAGGREPFLQRWLFSSRLVYVLVGAVVLLGLLGGGWYLTSGGTPRCPRWAS